MSFSRAFNVAAPGAVVHVGAGAYASCPSVTGSKRKFVTFAGATGARVVCPLVFAHADHVTVRAVTLYQVITRSSSHLRFQRLRVTCSDHAPYALYPPGNLCDARISLNDSSNLEFRRVVVGPTYDSSACGGQQTSVAFGVSNVTFSHVTFRDARWQVAPCGGADGSDNQHSENFYFSGVDRPARNIVFDSCRFTNGPASGGVKGRVADGSGPNSASLFLTGAFDRLTVRNCVFDGTGGAAIDGADDAKITNSLIENNTWTRQMIFQYPSYPSLSFVNNLGEQQSCPVGPELGSTGGFFSHNVWFFRGTNGSAEKCGATDLTVKGSVVNRIFVDYHAHNYHLKAGSPAIGRGDPLRHASRDRDGVRRPHGKSVDVGAYEFVKKPKAEHKSKPHKG